MNAAVEITPRAIEDIDRIWSFIAADSPQAADRVEAAIVAACHLLAAHPLIGLKRPDITHLPVRFWTVTRYPNYVIVYRPDSDPVRSLPCFTDGAT
ncbi:MAG: type II toxin-antitoxin system RelE/ParE family toxin [Bryobacteraceae bacterium]|jgi:plasmid stabilization system protein ParE